MSKMRFQSDDIGAPLTLIMFKVRVRCLADSWLRSESDRQIQRGFELKAFDWPALLPKS